MRPAWLAFCAVVLAGLAPPAGAQDQRYYDVPKGAGPHDVAADPRPDGPVWYTAQKQGALGRLDPATGGIEQIPLGRGSAPHGVVVGPDGGIWVTDGGQNAIVRVDPASRAVRVLPLPASHPDANLNTAAFDRDGVLWFTGQNGVYGRVTPATGTVEVWDAPRGRGPYGIAAVPDGTVFYASLAGNHIARIDRASGATAVIQPPTAAQGARRIWSDSQGRLWVSEWNAGQVGLFDPRSGQWREWKLPGERPRCYAVYVDEQDKVWLSEWTGNAILRFDPATERFASYPGDRPGANVRQMHGRRGELWAAESGTDRLRVIRYP
jgi:virginiamycin B lyase